MRLSSTATSMMQKVMKIVQRPSESERPQQRGSLVASLIQTRQANNLFSDWHEWLSRSEW